jgi:hypothetical protein
MSIAIGNSANTVSKAALGGAVISPNQSFLSQIGFQFSVKKLPTVNFFVTKALLPGMSLQNVKVKNPFATLNMPADHIEYGPLQITFKVDEDMQNWLELYSWFIGIGKPKSFEQRARLMNNNSIGEGLYSDGELVVLSNARNPNVFFKFQDLIPTEISQIDLDTTATDVEFVECTVSFNYTLFEVTNPLSVNSA